jgi:hypothetical protein
VRAFLDISVLWALLHLSEQTLLRPFDIFPEHVTSNDEEKHTAD